MGDVDSGEEEVAGDGVDSFVGREVGGVVPSSTGEVSNFNIGVETDFAVVKVVDDKTAEVSGSGSTDLKREVDNPGEAFDSSMEEVIDSRVNSVVNSNIGCDVDSCELSVTGSSCKAAVFDSFVLWCI